MRKQPVCEINEQFQFLDSGFYDPNPDYYSLFEAGTNFFEAGAKRRNLAVSFVQQVNPPEQAVFQSEAKNQKLKFQDNQQ